MKKIFFSVFLLFAAASAAYAAPGTIYIDTGGCQTGSTTRCSGTTDSATATVSGASATITCSATTYTGSTPGCSLSGSPDLSGVVADGSQAIYLNCATNSNQKIFFISAVDDASDLVQTTTTPTGCTASTSDWGIGGRMIYASANIEAAVRPADTIQFNNTPATKASGFFTARVSGDSAGFITVQGKTGVRPVLETTATAAVIQGSAINNWRITNLELKRGGTSLNAITNTGAGWQVDNVKISQAATAGSGISTTQPMRVINCEFTNIAGDAYSSTSAGTHFLFGNYFHDNGANAVTLSGAGNGTSIIAIANVFDTNAGRGVLFSGAPTGSSANSQFVGNVFYANGNSGLEVTDADQPVNLFNNIFMNNGDAAGEYNVEWVAGSAEALGSHAYNVFYSTGGGGSGNVSGLTTNGTESTSDPLFVNAAGGNFAISNSSPAAATGFPGILLGSASTGYLDMGAIQRQVTGSSRGNNIRPGIGQ